MHQLLAHKNYCHEELSPTDVNQGENDGRGNRHGACLSPNMRQKISRIRRDRLLVIKSLSNFDVTGMASGAKRKLGVQIAFGLVCALSMIALRSVLDMMAPTAGPFALVYPTVLIATLFGHRLSGLVAYVVCFVWAWWFVLKPVNSFAFEDASDPARVAINAASALIVIALAEIFRKAVQDGNAERDSEIERRTVLMEELDHRTKNNFMMVSSLLAIQKSDLESQEAIDALEQASSRVHMFGKAYENLSETKGEGYPVEMREFLQDVIERVRAGGFDDNIEFSVSSSTGMLPRQTAVVIGIFVNEAITNCSKYAFPDGRVGQINVDFVIEDSDWQLVVADNGVGSNALGVGKPGRGAILMAALAKQVNAEHQVSSTSEGTRVLVQHTAEMSEPGQ